MDWLKKKTTEAKQAANQAAAKLQNKRTAFKGEGNVLGGGGGGGGGDSVEGTAPAASASRIKVPFVKSTPPPVSEEEKQRRREMQTKAAESRVNAWDKRVNAARNARIQREEQQENDFEALPVPPPLAPATSAAPTSAMGGPALSNEEVKARELESAHAQLGFNPYAATFSSSTEAGAAMNSIGGTTTGSSTPAPMMPPPAPMHQQAAPQSTASVTLPSDADASGAVYVLLRQDPPRAIAAAETIVKMLFNILQSPTEEKFRRIRLANASIQSKLVAVPGAVDLLREAGFQQLELDGEDFLVLLVAEEGLDVPRIQSVVDRTEVALMQLHVDSTTQ